MQGVADGLSCALQPDRGGMFSTRVHNTMVCETSLHIPQYSENNEAKGPTATPTHNTHNTIQWQCCLDLLLSVYTK